MLLPAADASRLIDYAAPGSRSSVPEARVQSKGAEFAFTCRQVIEQAKQILTRERGLSPFEADLCLFELAQAGKCLILEVASRIVDEGCAPPGPETRVHRSYRGQGHVGDTR